VAACGLAAALAVALAAVWESRPLDRTDDLPVLPPVSESTERSQGAAPGDLEDPPPRTGAEMAPGDRQTFLVLGVEAWEGEYGRSDTIIVAAFDPRDRRLALLSIPRDLMVEIPGHGYDKINHAHSFGGPDLAVATVERLLDLKLDHWVSFSLEGFMKTIDALGGIELNPTKRLYHVDPQDTRFGPEGFVIDIRPGPQVMDGRTALEYARFRADEEGDLGRMRRQQEVIRAVIKKASTPAILARAPELISAMYSAVGTDLTVGEMLRLAATGRDVLNSPITAETLTAEELWLDGIFYFVADLVETRRLAYELLVGEPPPEDYLEQARADNERFQAYVAERTAMARARAQQETPVVQSVRIFYSTYGTEAEDLTLSGDTPEGRAAIAEVTVLLDQVEWLDDPDLGPLPVTPPSGKPMIVLSYADGSTMTIEHAYRCQPEISPLHCEQVDDAVVIGDRAARSVELVDLMSRW